MVSGTVNAVLQVLFAYLWWSIFQVMPGVLWFYPLCLMKISGYELLGALWLSPILMKFRRVRQFVTKPFGLMVMRTLALVLGLGSHLSSSTVLHVQLIAVGNFFAMLALAGSIWDKSTNESYCLGYLHMLGYLMYLAVRIWGSSFNYIFMSNSLNIAAIFVGVALSVLLYVDNIPAAATNYQTSPSNRQTSPSNRQTSSSKSTSGKTKIPNIPPTPGLVASGLAFGSLLFLTSFLYSEVSIITRWSVGPQPFPGPQPYPWGMATLAALSIGIVLFGSQDNLITSVQWFSVGMISSMVLYFGKMYTAFFGGLVLAVYAGSLWPLLLKRVVLVQPHKLFAVAVPVYFGYILLSVWVVAYNFVPGGVVTRERTDVLLIVIIFCCGLGTCDFLGDQSTAAMNSDEKAAKEARTVTVFGRAFRRLSVIEEEQSQNLSECTENMNGSPLNQFHQMLMKGTSLILFFAFLGYLWRYQADYPPPAKEHPRVFSAAIWAFHFGYDNQGWPSMERAAQFIEDADVDVIGLLETDAARPYIGSHDIASWLGERLHMHTDYGPGTDEHTWGTLVLSKYPIVQSQHHLLPSPHGEIAPAIMATVNISGELVDFYVVHFGNDVDDLDRKLQAKSSTHILANSTGPVVVLSYITCKPGTRDYITITHVVKDLDPSDKKRFCEYIFYGNLTRVAYARISHGGLSDTEMQVGKFLIQEPTTLQDWNYSTIDPKEIPSWMHFPDKFGGYYPSHYGDQSRHHYQMNTPKYFKSSN